MREKVELLENHTHLKSYFSYCLKVFAGRPQPVDGMQFKRPNQDLAIFEIFEAIDSSQKCALAAA